MRRRVLNTLTALLLLLCLITAALWVRSYLYMESCAIQGRCDGRRLGRRALPPNWRDSPPPPDVQRIGDDWVTAGSSPVLRVPSAVIPSDFNYLINPRHPDFRHLTPGREEPYRFDPRLLKRPRR